MTRPLLGVFCLCALVHAQTPALDQVYSFDPKVVRAPVPIGFPEAEMPDAARRQQLNGLCVLQLVVDRKGQPQDPHIVHCTDPIFAENSLKALSRYRFQPATAVVDNKPVLFRLHIEISYRFRSSLDPITLPPPRIQVGFLIPSEPTPAEPDSEGIYTLSHDFDPPNSPPKLQHFANAAFGKAAFSLDDGVSCIATLTIDETGKSANVKITKCDDSSLEYSAVRSLLLSRFSPATLNGKPVPVRASVRLVCEGFEPANRP